MRSIFIPLPQSRRYIINDVIARYRYQLGRTLTTCYRPLQEYQNRFRDNV